MRTLKTAESKSLKLVSPFRTANLKLKLRNALTNSTNVGLPVLKLKFRDIAGVQAGLEDENEY